MRIALATDNHFCEKSSIVQKMGTKYTLRLENQLKSIEWFERLAVEKHCDAVIYLGDFFDKSSLTDKEITATKDIFWNDLKHYFIIGNHESGDSGLLFSSTKTLESTDRILISEAKKTDLGNCELCFLPYVTESDRIPLSDYFGTKTLKQRIILSHNDIAGIQMGPVVSRTGFSIEEIESNCDLFINGHLHNGQAVTNKIINLGNLTGKDFGEDASRYQHKIIIIDTDTFAFETIENPYAFNFYKFDILTENDLKVLNTVKTNAVVSIKCVDKYVEYLREKIAQNPNIIDTRIILIKTFEESDNSIVDISDLTVDQCVKFAECCREKLDNTPILEAELAEILK
jgi:DNA repair exonuclease SbcCD nuclease subunit